MRYNGDQEKGVDIDNMEGQEDERGKSHYVNSSEGCLLANATWTTSAESSVPLSCGGGVQRARGAVEKAKASANTLRRCEETLQQCLVAAESHEGQCDSLFAVKSGDLDKCLLDIKQERTSNGP